MGHPRRVVRKLRVARQLRQTDKLAESGELRIVTDCNDHVAIPDGEGRPQGLVALHDGLETLRQRREAERAAQTDGGR